MGGLVARGARRAVPAVACDCGRVAATHHPAPRAPRAGLHRRGVEALRSVDRGARGARCRTVCSSRCRPRSPSSACPWPAPWSSTSASTRGAPIRQLGDQAAQQRAAGRDVAPGRGGGARARRRPQDASRSPAGRGRCAQGRRRRRTGRAGPERWTRRRRSSASSPSGCSTRLVDMLDQIQGQLAGQVGPGAGRRVAGRRGRRARCVRAAAAGVSRLVDPATWPHRYERLLLQTTQREAQPSGGAAEVARRIVGGGGFSVSEDGRDVARCRPPSGSPSRGPAAPCASRPPSVSTTSSGRARLWLYRPGTAFGDFLDQGLASYVSGLENGRPVADLQGAARSVPGRAAARPAELESAGADRSGGLPAGAPRAPRWPAPR